MRDLAADLASKGFELLAKLVGWHWSKSRAAWESAWYEPALGLRLFYLVCVLGISVVLVPHAFRELGVMGGISYFVSLFGAISNATFFRIERFGRVDNVPLGFVAPIAILLGLAGSLSIRPLLGDAKNAAMAEDFIGAVVILAVFGFVTLWFRRWQSGNPYS